MKRLLIIFLLLFICSACVNKGGEKMYVAVYDREFNHITNIINAKYEITKRVFDFDTGTIEGFSNKNIANGFIFALCNSNGKQIYSGFMKSIKQEENKVVFKVEDFKTIFDTEVVLDYATMIGLSPKTLGEIYRDVTEAVKLDIEDVMNIEFINPNPDDYIDWIANYDTQHIIINAINFLKPYLAYYQYRIKMDFDTIEKKINCQIVKNEQIQSIKLDDFVYEKTKSDIAINKAVAIMKFDNVDSEGKMWIFSSENYWMQSENKGEILQMFPEPLDDANNYDYGYALKILMQEQGAPEPYPIYYQVTNSAVNRPGDLPKKVFYLGNDNLIYETNIPTLKMILPIKSKIFEDGFFQKAQFNAINELVNNRYNENIIITNAQTPIDLSDLELYTMVHVYDKYGTLVIMPLSEIMINNENYAVKLGFKKTLFTEIIKNKTQDAIKNTNGSGGTTIIEDASVIYSETEPVGAQEGSIWLKPVEIIEEQ